MTLRIGRAERLDQEARDLVAVCASAVARSRSCAVSVAWRCISTPSVTSSAASSAPTATPKRLRRTTAARCRSYRVRALHGQRATEAPDVRGELCSRSIAAGQVALERLEARSSRDRSFERSHQTARSRVPVVCGFREPRRIAHEPLTRPRGFAGGDRLCNLCRRRPSYRRTRTATRRTGEARRGSRRASTRRHASTASGESLACSGLM